MPAIDLSQTAITINSTKSYGQVSSTTLVGTMYVHFILNVHALGFTLSK